VALDREDVVELLLSRGASLEVGIAVAERCGVREVIDKMLALRPVSGTQEGWTVVEEE
jgi:hypothetical protein